MTSICYELNLLIDPWLKPRKIIMIFLGCALWFVITEAKSASSVVKSVRKKEGSFITSFSWRGLTNVYCTMNTLPVTLQFFLLTSFHNFQAVRGRKIVMASWPDCKFTCSEKITLSLLVKNSARLYLPLHRSTRLNSMWTLGCFDVKFKKKKTI